MLSLGDLTIKKKHNVQTRKRTQAYSTQHTRKQIQELSTIALQARVRPWLNQQETLMYSYFSWHMQQRFEARRFGKTSAWKMFLEKHNLLSSVGEGNLTTTKIKDAEKFVCSMYKHEEVESVNQIRVLLFRSVESRKHYLQRVMLWNCISGVPTINLWYGNKHVANIQIFQILTEWGGLKLVTEISSTSYEL